MLLLLAAIIFIVAKEASLGAKAQELTPPARISVSTARETDVSAEKIFDALQSGGLSSKGDLGIEPKNPSFEAAVSPSVSDPDQPAIQDSGSVDSDPLSSDTFEYLEAKGGLVAGASTSKVDTSQPTVFKLAADFLDKVVFKNYAEFFKRAVFDNGFEVSGQPTFDLDTAGYAVIKKGNQSVKIDFDKKYKATPVVTASLSVQQYDDPEVRAAAEELLLISDVKYVVTNVTSGSFEIMMDRKADSDIPFSWHTLAVRDPKIFKKEAKKESADNSQNKDSGFSVDNSLPASGSFSGVAQQGDGPSVNDPSAANNSAPGPGGGDAQGGGPADFSGNNVSR